MKNVVYHPEYRAFGPSLAGGGNHGRTCWYPWREVDGGVIYGDVDAPSQQLEDRWSQGNGVFPNPRMQPFE